MSAERTTPEAAIPLEVAIRLCDEILEESRRRPFAMVAWQCRGCAYRAHGDSAHKGFSEAPGNRGCPMVNQRWEELGRPMA